MQVRTYDEETGGFLKKIVERQAYRQLMLANIRAHGIKFLPDVAAKMAMASDLQTALRHFAEVEALYAALGHGDVVSAVRDKMERIPYPGSRLELAVCLFLCENATRLALSSYVDGACVEFGAVARTRLEVIPDLEAPADPVFVEFCAEAENRPHAQQLFNRWLSVALLALGRPDSKNDARAVELGLRSRPMTEIAREYVARVQAFLERCKLAMPDAATLGVELPAGASAGAARTRAKPGATS